MSAAQSRGRLTAEDVAAAVRVHADRVHDALRRLGCPPDVAAEVVQRSAADLLSALRSRPASVGDVVGWWFARAWQLGRSAAGSSAEVPLGGGLLGADEEQARVAEALEDRPERDRMALLLRDSYALPLASVATALGLAEEAALELVGQARLRLLPGLTGEVAPAVPSRAGHQADLPGLARLAEGGPVAARDATTRRHAQSCRVCGGLLRAQEQVRQALAGLSVVALPDPDREQLLTRVDAQARTFLPSSASPEVVEEEEEEDLPPRTLSPLLIALGVIGAVVLGVLIGVVASRQPKGHPVAVSQGVIPPPSAIVPTLPPAPTGTSRPTASSTPSVTTTVFTVPPQTTAPPASAAASGRPTSTAPAEPLSLTVTPAQGPNGADVTVNGAGWQPLRAVTVDYLDTLGRPTGSSVTVTADVRGRFTTHLAAEDPTNIPGQHTVRASNGRQTQTAAYNAGA